MALDLHQGAALADDCAWILDDQSTQPRACRNRGQGDDGGQRTRRTRPQGDSSQPRSFAFCPAPRDSCCSVTSPARRPTTIIPHFPWLVTSHPTLQNSESADVPSHCGQRKKIRNLCYHSRMPATCTLAPTLQLKRFIPGPRSSRTISIFRCWPHTTPSSR